MVDNFVERAAPCVQPEPRIGSVLGLCLMFASGAAGLVWQMVWTAQFGLGLGHEMVAVLSVMAAFFGGISAGSLLLAQRIERSAQPARWYVALEVLIGAWALLVTWVSTLLMPQLSVWIGAEPSALWHWTLAFFIPLFVLLPATLAMGATLPAVERLLRQGSHEPLGRVYAANTAGAMAGLLVAVFWFIPHWGLLSTSVFFAGINGACALLAWLYWRKNVLPEASSSGPATPGTINSVIGSFSQPLPKALSHPVATQLFLSGLLGIGYEVLAVRVLSQVTENTVYTYTLLLAVFLLGTAWGAALLNRSVLAEPVLAERTDRALIALVLAMLLGGLSLWWADRLTALPALWWGPGVGTALAGEGLAAMAALLLPAMAMGALFTLLCRQAQHERMSLGVALGINTLGAAIAPLVVGLLLLPHWGAKTVLLVLLVGYLAMRTRKAWLLPEACIAAFFVVLLAVFAGPLRFVDVPSGGRLLSYREGAMAAVSVVQDSDGVARLHINNRVQEGSSASGLVEIRLAQLPLLLHPSPRTALFLGYGTGYTANAAALDPRLSVKAVELLPEVIDAAGIFALKPGAPASATPVATVAADARRYVQSSSDLHDVIVADLFHPARSGAGSLYTVEHFAAVKSRLQPNGLFCQWLALHQMDVETLRSIVASFLKVYPQAVAVLASNSLDTPVVGLVSRPGKAEWLMEDVRERMSALPPTVAKFLKQAKLDNEFAVMGSVVAGPQSLRTFAAGAKLNTDDQPVVAHRAPWVSYAPEETPQNRLTALMASVAPSAADVMGSAQAQDAAQLEAYWLARAKYLAFGMTVKPQLDPRAMLIQLRQPLLDMVAISPNFQPAVEPLLALSEAVRTTHPDLSAEVRAALNAALSYPRDATPLTPLKQRPWSNQ